MTCVGRCAGIVCPGIPEAHQTYLESQPQYLYTVVPVSLDICQHYYVSEHCNTGISGYLLLFLAISEKSRFLAGIFFQLEEKPPAKTIIYSGIIVSSAAPFTSHRKNSFSYWLRSTESNGVIYLAGCPLPAKELNTLVTKRVQNFQCAV